MLDEAVAEAADHQEYLSHDDRDDAGRESAGVGFVVEQWPPTPVLGAGPAAVEDVTTQTERLLVRLVWLVLGELCTVQLYFDASRLARETVEQRAPGRDVEVHTLLVRQSGHPRREVAFDE